MSGIFRTEGATVYSGYNITHVGMHIEAKLKTCVNVIRTRLKWKENRKEMMNGIYLFIVLPGKEAKCRHSENPSPLGLGRTKRL